MASSSLSSRADKILNINFCNSSKIDLLFFVGVSFSCLIRGVTQRCFGFCVLGQKNFQSISWKGRAAWEPWRGGGTSVLRGFWDVAGLCCASPELALAAVPLRVGGGAGHPHVCFRWCFAGLTYRILLLRYTETEAAWWRGLGSTGLEARVQRLRT